MHPLLEELFMKPVGWMTIIGGIIMIGSAVVVGIYIRRKMKEEERNGPRR